MIIYFCNYERKRRRNVVNKMFQKWQDTAAKLVCSQQWGLILNLREINKALHYFSRYVIVRCKVENKFLLHVDICIYVCKSWMRKGRLV